MEPLFCVKCREKQPSTKPVAMEVSFTRKSGKTGKRYTLAEPCPVCGTSRKRFIGKETYDSLTKQQ